MDVNLRDSFIFGASVTGKSHIQNNTPCQDSFAHCILNANLGVISVSDGVGSESLSHIGSKIAVTATIEKIKELYENGTLDKIDLADTINQAMTFARDQLEERTKRQGWALSDFACTLITIVFYRGQTCVGHIGDGAVIGYKTGKFVVLSEPEASEYSNEVWPITCLEWRDHVKVSNNFLDVQFISVFTDGCQDTLMQKTENNWQPYEPLLIKLFEFAQQIPDIPQANRDIEYLLSSEKMSENSNDDKTLVLSIIGRSDST